MFFSPITERSLRVRVLYLCLYGLLTLGGVTMVVPLVLMLSGSVEPGSRGSGSAFFPSYLLDDTALWKRYLQAKYKNRNEWLRMAWGRDDAGLADPTPPLAPGEQEGALALWDEFTKTVPVPENRLTVGFCDVRTVTPYYYNRAFQNWCQSRSTSIEALNRDWGSTFKSFRTILPPNAAISGPALAHTPFIEGFLEFSQAEVTLARKFAWDSAGFYRAVFLPRTVGPRIDDYNARYGTTYRSYAEVPFEATVPSADRDSWFLFVSKLLRPDFVELTPEGKAHRQQSGLGHDEFIRLSAKPEDLRVATLDQLFAVWAFQTHGVEGVRIPQQAIDSRAFRQEKGFWRSVFLTQNYQYVLDAILLQGHALKNTVILVVLMVGGSLIVNPLAAYALSRFKLRQTYSVLLFFLATIAFPAEVTMIPVFLQLKETGLLNTYGALVLPTLANGFSIFLLKGFFDSLPRELYEAAEIDGAGEWRMFWMIAMNLSRPILAVKALSAFVAAYGAFFYALILAPDPRMWTIMVYVYQLQQSAGTPVVYASLILTAIPTLLIFIFCQNIILRGIVVPSEK